MTDYAYEYVLPTADAPLSAGAPRMDFSQLEEIQRLQSLGRFPLSKPSLGNVSSLVVKTGGGTLFGFSGYNSGPAQFVQIFDAQAVPADTTVPNGPIIAVAATANMDGDWGSYGRRFFVGIVFVVSTTQATKTLGSANCSFDVQYV